MSNSAPQFRCYWPRTHIHSWCHTIHRHSSCYQQEHSILCVGIAIKKRTAMNNSMKYQQVHWRACQETLTNHHSSVCNWNFRFIDLNFVYILLGVKNENSFTPLNGLWWSPLKRAMRCRCLHSMHSKYTVVSKCCFHMKLNFDKMRRVTTLCTQVYSNSANCFEMDIITYLLPTLIAGC